MIGQRHDEVIPYTTKHTTYTTHTTQHYTILHTTYNTHCTYLGTVPLGQGHDEVVGVGRPGRSFDLLLTGARLVVVVVEVMVMVLCWW